MYLLYSEEERLVWKLAASNCLQEGGFATFQVDTIIWWEIPHLLRVPPPLLVDEPHLLSTAIVLVPFIDPISWLMTSPAHIGYPKHIRNIGCQTCTTFLVGGKPSC